MPGTIILVDPHGETREVPTEAAGLALEQPGWRVQTDADRLGRLSDQAKEVDYGGAAGAAKAGVAGVARGVTLGLSDVAARAFGGDDAAFDLSALRDANPGISTASEFAGAAAPAFLSGGASTPASAAARLGGGIAKLGAEAGTVGRIGYAAAGGAAEGGVYGLGAGVSELALSDEPLTLEHAVSTLSSNTLFGVATGGIAGGALKAGELGLARAKGTIDEALARRSAKALTPAEAIDTGDLALLDKPTLKLAREAELETLERQREPLRQQFVDDLGEFRVQGRREQLWTATDGAAERDVRTAGRNFTKADLALDHMLANKTGLAERPARALGALQQQRQALGDIESYGQRMWAEYDAGLQTDREAIGALIRERRIPGEMGPFTSDGLDLAVDREVARRAAAREAGPDPELAKRFARFGRIPAAIERNDRLQKAIADLSAEPVSERLAKIAQAEEALGVPRAPSLAEQVIGAIPFAGPLATVMSASKKAIGGLRGAASKAAERTGKAVSSFLEVAGKGANKAAPYAPVLATKVLGSVSYGPAPKVPRQPSGSGSEATLPHLYRARTDEIKEQVHIAADGSFQMRPQARAQMAARVAAVGPADPRAADRMETIASRRIEWLASQIPRRPDLAGIQTGPDHWQPSDMEMRSFARKVAAAEDPHAVIERLAHGAVTPEDADAMRAVYPELMSDVAQQLIQALPTLQHSLPYNRRLALSIFSGVPVDPAMTPHVLAALQAQFEYQPEQPRAKPQFGSVKSREHEQGTLSQRRELGTT